MHFESIKLLHDGYLKVYRLKYTTNFGNPTHYQMVSRMPLGSNGPVAHDMSVMGCVRCENKVLAILEFRAAINEYIYSLPCGMYKHNESSQKAIIRELEEECGLLPYELTALKCDSPGYIDPGLTNSRLTVWHFSAQKSEDGSFPGSSYGGVDDREEIKCVWLDKNEFEKLCDKFALVPRLIIENAFLELDKLENA